MSNSTLVSTRQSNVSKSLGRLAVVAAAMVTMSSIQSANASVFNQTAGTTTATAYDYGDSANWIGGVPDAVDAVADFRVNATGNQVVNLNANRTVGTLNFGDTTAPFFTQTINAGVAGSVLVFDVSSGNAVLTNQNANAAINSGITLNDNLVVSGGGTTVTLSGVITGTGGITKNDVGTLRITAANTYTGGFTANLGSVDVGFSNTPFGPNSSRLTLNGGQLTSSQSNGITLGNKITLGGNFVLGPGNNPFSLSNTTADGFIINAVNPILTYGSNTATNRITDIASVISEATPGNGLTLRASADGAISSLSGTTSATATGTFTFDRGILRLNKSSSAKAINGNFVVGGGPGTTTARASYFNNSTDMINNASTVQVLDRGTFDINSRVDTVNTLDVRSGGTFLLTTGRLSLGTPTTTGAGIFVNDGGTLRGDGTLSALVTANGGTIAPGNTGGSPGTLTVGADLLLNPGAGLAYELTANDTTVGGGVNDLLDLVNNLTLDGTINFSNTGPLSDGTFRLINYSGTLVDNGLDIGTLALASGKQAAIDTSTAGQVNLVVSSTGVPEPTTIALLGLGGLGLLARRRRN